MKISDSTGTGRKRWLLPVMISVIVVVMTVAGITLFNISYNLSHRSRSYRWYFKGHVMDDCNFAVRAIDELNKSERREKEVEEWYRMAAGKWPFDNFAYCSTTGNTFSRSEIAQYFTTVKQKIKGQYTVQPLRRIFVILGFFIMGFLMFMRNRFGWWPLHPIGFPFAMSEPIMRFWFSICIGWLLKLIILKYGGVKVFNRLKPVFLGLIIGSVVGGGFGFLFDCLGFMGGIIEKGCFLWM